MKLSHRIMLPMAAIALLGAGAIGAGTVSAATSSQPGTLAQKIASTFHIDAAQVQDVINQNHTDNQQKHEATYEAKLTADVTAGKITAAQKQAILAENAKLKAELDAAASSSDKTARRTAMKNVRTEAQTWATANNIDIKYLMVGGMHPRGGKMGDNANTPPANAPATQ